VIFVDHATDMSLFSDAIQVEVDLWVPRTSSTSRDEAILVDQTTDASPPSDAVLLKIDRFG
jgi:hypothetical protein